ncbi:hypothetical protein HPB47_008018 [Ixodes persulcatus]|uniref:Uncharacterized protein n=1 Tax=Ixodes persulcatus TaxID=34615 RepID=A0AC60P686_IXOPE|nr:hypothetical protein HPB47_008018 [Ixodes persulcatus]
MAPMKTCTVPPVLAILFVAFFCSTREAQGQETITTPPECAGTFKVHSTQVTLLVQQRVVSQDDVFNCQYVFEAPESAGLLVFANGITAIDDGEIPGCPVKIYDGDNQQVSSLCGHYDTTIIPVSSPRVTVAYRPEYQGSPYTLTLDLQVTRSDDDTSVLCADAELYAVPSVPVKYGVVLRDDGSASDDEQICDYKVVSNAVNETLKTGCLLTSGGDCAYEVLLSNGSQLGQAPGLISLAEVGGEATVRLHPRSLSGVLTLTLPGDFEPVFSLERPPNLHSRGCSGVRTPPEILTVPSAAAAAAAFSFGRSLFLPYLGSQPLRNQSISTRLESRRFDSNAKDKVIRTGDLCSAGSKVIANQSARIQQARGELGARYSKRAKA